MNTYEFNYPSGSSLAFRKTDDDGIPSTFFLHILPEYDGAEKLKAILVVDSEIKEGKKYFRTIDPDAKFIISEFSKWAPDAPLEYHTKIGDHIDRCFRTSKVKKKTSLEGEVGTDGAKVKAGYNKTKEL